MVTSDTFKNISCSVKKTPQIPIKSCSLSQLGKGLEQVQHGWALFLENPSRVDTGEIMGNLFRKRLLSAVPGSLWLCGKCQIQAVFDGLHSELLLIPSAQIPGAAPRTQMNSQSSEIIPGRPAEGLCILFLLSFTLFPDQVISLLPQGKAAATAGNLPVPSGKAQEFGEQQGAV